MGHVLGPRSLINIVCLIILALFIFISDWSRRQPYLGFDLKKNQDGQLAVTAIQNPTLISQLKSSLNISRIESERGGGFNLRPEQFSTSKIEKRRAYLNKPAEIDAKDDIYNVLTNGNLRLITAEGDIINFALMENRPISQLGSVFWIRLAFGALAVIMGALVWAWKPTRCEHILLLISGSSLFLMTIPSAIEGIEMFVASGYSLWLLDYVTLLGTLSFLISSSLTLIYFPQTFSRATLWRNFLLAFFACFTLTILFNKWDIDVAVSEQRLYATSGERYSAIVLGYFLILMLCVCQLLISRHKPLQRMQSKSVMLAWLTGPTILMLFYLVPIAYLKIEPPLSRTWAWGCITLSYLMVLIGVGRVKLFENEKYVATVWQWFFITILFVTLDLVLVFFIGVDPKISSALLFIIVLWFYLPLRHWLFSIFAGQDNDNYQAHFVRGINLLTSYSVNKSSNATEAWQQALKQIFNPVSFQWLQDVTDVTDVTQIGRSGQTLTIRSSEFLPGASIEFADRGTRLFNQQDELLADSLVLFYEKLCSFQAAFIEGQQLERRRIGRDLHDQIGHDLLSLIYSAKDQESRLLAQNTMQRLREVIRALDHHAIALEALANEISNIYLLACNIRGVTPHFVISDIECPYTFNSSIYLNVLNIFRELLSNTIKHSQAKNVWFSLSVNEGQVVFSHRDDGVGFDFSNHHDGFGLHNIRERAQEIFATANWVASGTEFSLSLNILDGAPTDGE